MENKQYQRGEIIAEAIIKEYWNYNEVKRLCLADDDSGEFIVYTSDDSTDEQWFKDINDAWKYYNSIDIEGFIEAEEY